MPAHALSTEKQEVMARARSGGGTVRSRLSRRRILSPGRTGARTAWRSSPNN